MFEKYLKIGRSTINNCLFFLILDNPLQSERLDTLEEVSEPASSEYWQLDSIGSKESPNVTTNATTGKNISITKDFTIMGKVGIKIFSTILLHVLHF